MSKIEANSEFTNKKRASTSFLPNDPAAASFLEVCTSLAHIFCSGEFLSAIVLCFDLLLNGKINLSGP